MFVRLAAVAAVALVLPGCGDDGGADGVQVVATTGFAADVVTAVAGGDAAVEQLVPDSAEAHSYGASAKDRRTLAEADLIVAFGRNYEEGLPLDEAEAPRFEITEHAGPLRPDDPHVWMDPTRIAESLGPLADALADADPEHAAAYRERAARYARELERLDREIRAILAGVPAERRKLVTSHDSLGYFADRYDFEFVGAPFGVSPEAEASASGLAEVIEKVREERVPAVFATEGDDPKVMRQVAAEAEVEIVDDLLVENPGPQAQTYREALLFDARRIAEALAP